MLMMMNAYIAVLKFKDGDMVFGVLWTITVPLWLLVIVMDVIRLYPNKTTLFKKLGRRWKGKD